jgi:hypothetical protein
VARAARQRSRQDAGFSGLEARAPHSQLRQSRRLYLIAP